MKSLFILFITTINITFAQQASIKGVLPTKYAGKSVQLTLINYETRKDKKLQEVTVTTTGAFAFVIPLTEPAIYNISVADSTLLQVLAKPTDAIALKVNSDAIEATGSEDTKHLISYE